MTMKVRALREAMTATTKEGAGPRDRAAIEFLDAATLATPLPPKNWLCEGLGLAKGAPVCVAGYSFSGKTMLMQSFALSVAAGVPAWGVFRVRQGRVVRIDHEQGDEEANHDQVLPGRATTGQ